MIEKIVLKEFDSEPWSYTMYRSDDGRLVGDFCYSPKSFADSSMLILLNEDELEELRNTRGFYSRMAKKVRENYEAYRHRALDRSAFEFK